ncbi:MAG: hypothetical protein ACRDBI_14725 [Shewanella sp.]
MSMLAGFMNKLGQDAQLLAQYQQDPRGVMRAHGLSAAEIEAVMTADEDKLKEFAGGENYQSIVHVTNPS